MWEFLPPKCIFYTCSNIDVSLSHAFPAANSPAATIDTSTPRGLSSCLKHKAKPSRPACVAHWAPRTGVGIFDKAENWEKKRKLIILKTIDVHPKD